MPSLDAIQEFKVLTYNYSAEWGTRARSDRFGDDEIGLRHNSMAPLFEFFRNTDLDARSFFATNTEKFNLNQFGGSLGGPIRKDKTFFFADFEQKDQRHGIPFTGLVPTVAMRSGDFTDDAFGNPNHPGLSDQSRCRAGRPNTDFQCDAAGNPLPAARRRQPGAGANCNKIPQSLINPIGQKLINLYPLPNANNPALGYNYVSEPVTETERREFDIRLDQNFSANDSVFARFSYDQATSYVPGGAPGFAEASPFASNQGILNHARNVASSRRLTCFLRTRSTSSRVGYNRIFDYISSQGTGSCDAPALGIPGANLGGESCGLTSTQLDGGYWSLGDRGYTPFQGGTNVYSVSDSLDMIRGSHDIKVGSDFAPTR